MIHDICLSWPAQDYDVDYNFKDVKGDTILFNILIDGFDLSECKIRCEISDYGHSIQIANELAGGFMDEVILGESESGTSAVQIVVGAGLTKDFQHYGKIEVEIETADGLVFTILNQRITFLEEKIDWDIPA